MPAGSLAVARHAASTRMSLWDVGSGRCFESVLFALVRVKVSLFLCLDSLMYIHTHTRTHTHAHTHTLSLSFTFALTDLTAVLLPELAHLTAPTMGVLFLLCCVFAVAPLQLAAGAAPPPPPPLPLRPYPWITGEDKKEREREEMKLSFFPSFSFPSSFAEALHFLTCG